MPKAVLTLKVTQCAHLCFVGIQNERLDALIQRIDRAISAKTDNRPEFQQMIKDSDKKLFDIVLVWKLDRFARNRYDSARYKTQLKKNGVKLMSATEIISEGPEGIILESVLEGYADTTPPTLPRRSCVDRLRTS